MLTEEHILEVDWEGAEVVVHVEGPFTSIVIVIDGVFWQLLRRLSMLCCFFVRANIKMSSIEDRAVQSRGSGGCLARHAEPPRYV